MADKELNPQQKGIVERLVEKYGIDGSKVLFLNSKNWLEPWIPPSELKSIARISGGFKRIAVRYDNYIAATEQVICVAEIVDNDGVEYSNFGVATIGETNGLGAEISADVLASGRAMSATLNDAGFNPLKSNSVVNAENSDNVQNVRDFGEASVKRLRDLNRIHALAEEAGLIVRREDKSRDKAKYRSWLYIKFPHFFNSPGEASSSGLTESERQQVINQLTIASEIEGVKQAA